MSPFIFSSYVGSIFQSPFGFIDRTGALTIDFNAYNSIGMNPQTWIPHDTAVDVFDFAEGKRWWRFTRCCRLPMMITTRSLIQMDKCSRGGFSNTTFFKWLSPGYVDGFEALGLYRCNGTYVISPSYDQAKNFSEETCPVEIGGLWGYVSKNGKLAIAPQFDEAQIFRSG